LYNNNESNYFFLYREPHLGLDGDYCIFLQLPISVKAEGDYDTLLEGKFLQLEVSFQHKLGYLVGTLYSRIGTEDWLPRQCTEEQFRKYIEDPLKDTSLMLCLEIDIHRKILDKLSKLQQEERTIEKFRALVEELNSQKEVRRNEMLDIIESELSKIELVDKGTLETLKKRLRSDPKFRSLIK
jgi:hypothetical protein